MNSSAFAGTDIPQLISTVRQMIQENEDLSRSDVNRKSPQVMAVIWIYCFQHAWSEHSLRHIAAQILHSVECTRLRADVLLDIDIVFDSDRPNLFMTAMLKQDLEDGLAVQSMSCNYVA